MARDFARLEQREPPEWVAACDPPGCRLGSGGGTAHLLVEAWRRTGASDSFEDWLRSSRKLVVHGGGQSRRLPAYAPVGKVLMPIPVFRWSRGQRLDQTLLDLQLPDYRRVLARAPAKTVAMVASGDVLLRFARELPALPDVDVLGLGMWVTPEVASQFGVFFTPRQRPGEVAFFLQKPSPARIRELAMEHLYLVDTGMWLLSQRAVGVLLSRCGWDETVQEFRHGVPERYELYAQFGLALGSAPVAQDAEVNALTCAVVPLAEAEFHHFGTSRQMIESITRLQNLELDETKLGLMGAKRHPNQYLQNADFRYPLRLEENHTLWVENSSVPASWKLACEHVLTGVPDNQWDLRLEPGVCLDFVPVGERDFCIRFYGLDDAFRGPIGEARTTWLHRPAPNWFFGRSINREAAGIEPQQDIQQAPLFPVLPPAEIEARFVEWLYAAQPIPSEAYANRWLQARRLSAEELCAEVNLARLYAQRAERRTSCLEPMLRNYRWSVFLKLDLESTARMYARSGRELPDLTINTGEGLEAMQEVHAQMFRGAVLRHRAQEGWQRYEERAFSRLREMIVRDAQLASVNPERNVQEDQIIWGRSPVRLDLAGGWTDTPPYCLEYGGKVVNLAVNLNGQPPIQVFAKLCNRPELVMRSIDLGVEQRVRTYDELNTFAQPGSEFALAKAALALAGFLPRFHSGGGYGSLADQLRYFGGGIEISMLSAVPKGSGLGASSILAATLLATLSELCGLNWDRAVLFTRTLALEQMLTTGGGWQDQAGAIFRGVKLIETWPGLSQKPTLRWLPDHLFGHEYANKLLLLYYTGLTRLAKGILSEIVRGVFLNSPEHLATISEIGLNAERAFHAIQKCEYQALVECVQASWDLNQRLDPGTNPPEVQQILDRVQDWLAAAKLLGAGGGGYLLILAQDEQAGRRIRQVLTENPPNARARFMSIDLSETGLQVTRS
jgi:galactokinase/mevalonate kinase-like predicted kinase